ncbi:RedB protein [Hyalangium rubrum]|uniref:RedB protein n=1 Tax=Hyalangium rubrum TaxID=3103134 RepID=A0ABU5GY13_9BACT|nr:RedB protein [Hyalangium sp. s54d21]MDY7226068.1 RedB protein [Hyalangium sp. s54d21]
MSGSAVSARYARGVLIATGLLWVVAVFGGMAALSHYATTPGESRESPARWPKDSALHPTPGRAQLVMLAHPRCPCTRASLGELEQVLAKAGGRAEAHVLFLRPEGLEKEWEKGELWQRAASIPGVTVREDVGGVEARRLGATTSGHVLLFDSEGLLRFSGGITSSRGHAGDNTGRATLEALLSQPEFVAEGRHPVYGCALEGPDERLAVGALP